VYWSTFIETYTACAVELKGKANAIKLIAKEYGHQFNIGDFPENDKAIIYHALEGWLNVKIKK
jgi:hypothetical protein